MEDDMKLQSLIGIIIASMILGGVLGWILKPCPCEATEPVVQSVVDVRIDSIPYEVAVPKIILKNTKSTDTVYRDTGHVYTTPAFTAELDTTIDKDSLTVAFDYPQHTFSVLLRRAPDTAMVPQTTITLTNTIYERRPWWMDALTHVGAATLGYGVGQLTR
jgi:hypothetical protein